MNKKKVVLCHGVFDVLHAGHIKYLKKAKELGDTLIVSVTSDKYVNKGPGRPIFNLNQRMGFLSDLQFVDKVYESNGLTAEKIIEKIKPDFYCKGIDYSNKSIKKDINLKKEIKILKKNNGVFIALKEEKFSSSKIINELSLQNLKKENIDFIKLIKKIKSFNEIISDINKFKKLKVLVVGEMIIDNYVFIDPVGKSGKEPILIYKKKYEKKFLGGTGYISNLLSSFVKSVDVLTCLGEKKNEFNFIKKNINKEVNIHLISKKNSPTIIKTRYLDSYKHNKIMGIYKINDEPISKIEETKVINKIKNLAKKCDLIITADYGHGYITKKVRSVLQKYQNKLYLNTQINSFNRGFHSLSNYKSANSLVLNESELRHEMKNQNLSLDELIKKLRNKMKIKNIIITRGRFGSIIFTEKKKKYHCPAFSEVAIDATGAGDTFFALASLGLCSKLSFDLINLISSIASSYSVNNLTNKDYYTMKLLNRHLNYMFQ
tara:strand:+ start:404 stop:1870 length:1467 start_codon:yes stop_codon:yes gene_type:complete